MSGEEYYVYVKGETLLASRTTIFEDQKQIRSNLKSLSIFVQTDKAVCVQTQNLLMHRFEI
jgi:hypothetical protein